MTKPPPQTKESIEKEYRAARLQQLNDFAMAMVANIMTELPEAEESIQVASWVLGSIIANTTVMNETSLKNLLVEAGRIVERHARATATVRANLEAMERGNHG